MTGEQRSPSDVVPWAVRVSAAWAWRFLLVVASLAVGLYLITILKVIVVPVAVALLLTVLLLPLVRWLQRRARFPRAAASGTAVVGLLVVVIGLLTVAGRSIAKGISDLQTQAVAGVQELTEWLSSSPLNLTVADITGYIAKAQASITQNSGGLVSSALSVTTTVGHVVAGALIAMFCTFFFLLDGRAIWTWLVGLLPFEARERTHQAARRGFVTLGAYTRTQILVALVDAVGIGIGAAVLRVPLALPLAILVFLGSFIPIVGAVLTGIVAVLVALVSHGPVVAVIMLAVVLLVQQIEGHVLQPFLMGHAVSLHPVAVLLSVAAGSLVAGITGALFAVPIAAVVNTVVLYLHGHDKFPELGTDDHVALRPPRAAVAGTGAETSAEPPTEGSDGPAEPATVGETS
ncbi:AI-2E family transporter [Cellulomonas sp. P24]|uniref:AI-2E family transporter n=1 Tax=Cellulomonas sp. P24 TaxID=2885206 RepID=UPI00216AE7D5|nr:AI-2E family transporter [Cellulomonas sp. P24]MCR6493818.1 AI-2E family transporter [Cellulomonas sp. P24]